jgi:TonB-dependent SusC/RagA subfamily outer membrane receptor
LPFISIAQSHFSPGEAFVARGAHSAPGVWFQKENQQDGRIKGVVTSDTGLPLADVSVGLKGTTLVVVTNNSGEFLLKLPEGTQNGTLVLTSVGYEAKEVAFNNLEPVSITLKSASHQLEDVVVVGYGTQRKKDVTGAVGSINSKDIKSLPVANAGEAMQGRAAGVQVVSSGAPGSNVTFRIRGIGTINNSDPLIVIDGVPTDIPLNAINPDDIATIDILKDASSAAIYGSRGANGVVLITTRRGSSNAGHLDFKAMGGVQQATSMVHLLDASQFASLHNEMMANNGQPQNPAFADPLSLGKGTDWLGALFRKAPMQSYSLAYSGGSPKST